MSQSSTTRMLALPVAALMLVGCATTRKTRSYTEVGNQSLGTATHNSLPTEGKALPVGPQEQGQVAPVVYQPPATATHGDATSVESFNGVVAATDVRLGEMTSEVGKMPEAALTLDLLEEMALTHNPAIQQTAAGVAQARGIYHQVGLKPNPSIGYFGEEIGNEGAGGLHGGFVSQTWVRGEKLAWNRRVIAQDVAAFQSQVHVLQMRILTDVRIAYYEVLSAQERLRLAEEFREVVQKGVQFAQARFVADDGTRPDVLQSEIQLSEVELAIQQSTIELSAAMQQLAALCGVADLRSQVVAGRLDEGLSGSDDFLLDEETLFANLLAASPELAVAQAMVDRACANVNRQKLQPIPNVQAQFGVGTDDASGDAFTNLQLSLPVPIRNRNTGNICAASAEYRAAVQNVERIRARLRRDLATVLREYNVAAATAQTYRTQILPKSRTALDLVQEAQAAGEFDFLRVLTTRRAFFDANIQYVSALTDLAQARARIDGQLLSDGLSQSVNYQRGDELRGQTFNGR